MYKNISIIRVISMVIYLGLGFFQKPVWCVKEKYDVELKKIFFYFLNPQSINLIIKDQCEPLSDHSSIPHASIYFFENWIVYLIETILMLFLVWNKFLKASTLIKQDKLRFRNNTLVFLLIITVISNVISLFAHIPFQIDSFIRPFFFVIYK